MTLVLCHVCVGVGVWVLCVLGRYGLLALGGDRNEDAVLLEDVRRAVPDPSAAHGVVDDVKITSLEHLAGQRDWSSTHLYSSNTAHRRPCEREEAYLPPVLFGVVDRVVRAHGPHKLEVPLAARDRHVALVVLRQLNGVGPCRKRHQQ